MHKEVDFYSLKGMGLPIGAQHRMLAQLQPCSWPEQAALVTNAESLGEACFLRTFQIHICACRLRAMWTQVFWSEACWASTGRLLLQAQP